MTVWAKETNLVETEIRDPATTEMVETCRGKTKETNMSQKADKFACVFIAVRNKVLCQEEGNLHVSKASRSEHTDVDSTIFLHNANIALHGTGKDPQGPI